MGFFIPVEEFDRFVARTSQSIKKGVEKSFFYCVQIETVEKLLHIVNNFAYLQILYNFIEQIICQLYTKWIILWPENESRIDWSWKAL